MENEYDLIYVYLHLGILLPSIFEKQNMFESY